jgi:hypothetical protein
MFYQASYTHTSNTTSRPSIGPNPVEFRPLARRPDAPKKLDDYLYSDEPQLSLHIVSFKDATLVSVTWPHTFFDAMGLSALFGAWTSVLCGQEDQVPPLYGFDADPLADLGASPTVQSVLANRQIRGLGMLLFAARYVFELLWWNKVEKHVICLPHSYLQTIKNTAIQELAAQDHSDSKPFLSDGDVIRAWCTRLAIQYMAPTSTRLIVITNVYCLRRVLEKDLLPRGTAYMSNAILGVFAFLPGYQIFQKPLSFVAAQIRRSIQEQGTRSQIEAYASLFQKVISKTGQAPLFGDSSAQMVIFSNWSKGKFFDIDFSSAVIKQGILLEKRANPLGRPSYIQSNGHRNGVSSQKTFPIFGKDAANNYWLCGTMRASVWRKVEENLQQCD